MKRRKRRLYSDQFKADAVLLVTSGQKSFAEVSAQFELTESALRDWTKAAEAKKTVTVTGALSTAERVELVELRKRLKRVEMERDILKKATAFFARESE